MYQIRYDFDDGRRLELKFLEDYVAFVYGLVRLLSISFTRNLLIKRPESPKTKVKESSRNFEICQKVYLQQIESSSSFLNIAYIQLHLLSTTFCVKIFFSSFSIATCKTTGFFSFTNIFTKKMYIVYNQNNTKMKINKLLVLRNTHRS